MSAADFPSLTAILHELVKLAPSELTASTIAELLGKDYNTLMSELSRQPGHKLGADFLLPLMELTGSDAPLNFLARERGGVFVPVRSDATVAELGPAILSSVKEFGDYAAEAARDIADGNIPADQLERILKEGQEAASAIVTFMELARAVHQRQCGSRSSEASYGCRQQRYGSRRGSPGGH